ncbi:MAG: hypothetical protein EBT50_04920 [Verrucomicrobia bacterium]|nr:hypothetical protein [Verrucomicrobiota bacterium]
MIRVLHNSLRWVVPSVWLLFPLSLNAMDAETSQTIADLKTQVQALMDEVKKLKEQVAQGGPPPARLNPPAPDEKPTPASPTSASVLPSAAALQPTMEQNVDGTTETAPAPLQQGDKRLPMLDVSEKGLIFRSEDNRHSIRLGGLLQLDDREFVDPPTSQESKFLVRRARPAASGYFYDDWNFRFAPEFAISAPNAVTYQTTIADAVLNYKPMEDIQVQAGKYKPPVALEQLADDAYLPFAERALTSNLSPSRDIGVMIHGRTFDEKLSWAAMVGAGARNNTLNTGLDYDTGPEGYFRLFAQPFLGEEEIPEAFHGLRIGIGGSLGWAAQSTAGTSLLFQNYSTDGGNTFFSFPSGLNVQGEHWRISPQLYYNYGPFGLLGEFISEKFTNYQSTAWNVTMNFMLTGEDATLDGIVPKEPVDFKNGQWGAWEMAIRYDGIAIGANAFRPLTQGGLGISATENATAANGLSWGLNWYINRLIRLGLTVEYQAFTGGGGQDVVAENSELGFITRLQLKY